MKCTFLFGFAFVWGVINQLLIRVEIKMSHLHIICSVFDCTGDA